jgi:hypothetical protein
MKKSKYKPLPGLRPCDVCGEPNCKIRYFIAVPLPRIMYLCDKDYGCVKEEARLFVKKFMGVKD